MSAPPLSDAYSATALDAAARRDLNGLQKEVADAVARHLVAAGNLVDTDPETALAHARYARRRASRIAVVREAAGIAAYHAGEWSEALAELRAARRMGGGPGHLAVMADAERAMERPERAIELGRSPEARELGRDAQIELAIVVAGARRDLGDLDAAVVALQIPELDPALRDPWSARLFYAYADNLLAAGRESDALQWFVHALDADPDGQTDADARVAELSGEPLVDEGIEFGLDADDDQDVVDAETDADGDEVADDPVDEDVASGAGAQVDTDALVDVTVEPTDVDRAGDLADDPAADVEVDGDEAVDAPIDDAAAPPAEAEDITSPVIVDEGPDDHRVVEDVTGEAGTQVDADALVVVTVEPTDVDVTDEHADGRPHPEPGGDAFGDDPGDVVEADARIDPAPADPVPADPVPADPVPADPVPAEPVPAEPAPAELADTEPADGDALADPEDTKAPADPVDVEVPAEPSDRVAGR